MIDTREKVLESMVNSEIVRREAGLDDNISRIDDLEKQVTDLTASNAELKLKAEELIKKLDVLILYVSSFEDDDNI